MLSKRCKYALRAMVYLAGKRSGEPVQIADVAEAEDIPRKYLEQILVQLRHAGLLASRMGKGGGYMLAKPASLISFGDIIRLTDGPLAPVSCVSKSAYKPCEECRDEAACAIRPVMQTVEEAISEVLDKTSLEVALDHAAKRLIEQRVTFEI